MGENRYFEKALSDFTYEAAIGGAIRHLADSGYTVRQIMEQLDFPVSYERVQKAVWEHLLRRGTILPEPPGTCRPKETVTYVREYDPYGKASFRRVVVQENGAEAADWMVKTFKAHVDTAKSTYSEEQPETEFLMSLQKKCERNQRDCAYVSFDFGLLSEGQPAQYDAMLLALEDHQKEYVVGLPWAKQRVYHKLDSHGLAILMQLYSAGLYQGECFFRKG